MRALTQDVHCLSHNILSFSYRKRKEIRTLASFCGFQVKYAEGNVETKMLILLFWWCTGEAFILASQTDLWDQWPISQWSKPSYPILGATIPFISSQCHGSKPSNFIILLVFLKVAPDSFLTARELVSKSRNGASIKKIYALVTRSISITMSYSNLANFSSHPCSFPMC